MQIVQVLAGFTLGQADLLRRAMGKKKAKILMGQKQNFLDGCKKNGIEMGLANTIFDLLTHFADYGFNKSHSAAYALVAWQTAYLKAHYPQEFMAAMLTSVMDTDKVTTYIEQCRRMGIPILPPDINASEAYFTVDGPAIRFGLAAVRNVGENALKTVTHERTEHGPFSSLVDFCARVETRVLTKRAVENLIRCGAFDTLGAKRSQLLAVLDKAMGEAQRKQRDEMSGQMGLFGAEVLDEAAELELPDIPEASRDEILAWEKETTGFYITDHPLDKYKDIIANLVSIASLKAGEEAGIHDKQVVRIAGLFTEMKRITTKKGETMCFGTLEDFTDTLETVIFPRVVYDHVNQCVVDEAVVLQGHVDIQEDETKLLVDDIWELASYQPEYYVKIPPEKDGQATYNALSAIFKKYHGTQVVFLQMNGRWRKTSASHWLQGGADVRKALTTILGEDAVHVR